MKLDNESIFVLHQHTWFCKSSFDEVSAFFNCETCFTNIDIFNEKVVQCKQCFKMLLKKCIESNICLSCMPLPLLYLNNDDKIDYIENDFYFLKMQPQGI